MRSTLVAFIAGIVLIVALAHTGNPAVVDPLSAQEAAANSPGALDRAHTIGQTFVAHVPRLSAIQVRWIVSDDFAFAPNSRVIFHLREQASDLDRASVAIPLAQIHHNDFASFDFPPIPDSQDRAYYFFLDASQAEITRGWFSVWASQDDTLPDGAVDFNGKPAESDLVMRAYFSPDLALGWATLRDTLARQPRAAFLAGLIWLGPGIALMFLAGERRGYSFVEMLARASGIGLAALSAGSLLALGLGAAVYGIAAALIAFGVVVRLIRAKKNPSRETRAARDVRRADLWSNAAPQITMIALALLSLATGFVQLWNLSTPLWVDSPAHAAYIKTFLVEGRLPLTEIYHLGYHSIAALLAQSSGATIPQAMILVGQVLVTQIGLATFLLSKRLTGSSLAGIASASSVWFLCPAPTYFVTWGRYPLLLGTAILPLALIAAIEWIEQPRFDPRALCVAGITLAGLGFAHIRLIAFYAIFVAIYFVCQGWRARRNAAPLGRIAGLAGAGALIGAIWIAALGGNQVGLDAIFARNAGAPQIDLDTAFAVMRAHYGNTVWVMTGIGIGVTLMRRSWVSGIALAWFAALAGLALVAGEFIAPSFVVLMFFFPAALILGELARAAKSDRIVLLICILASLFGAREMWTIINPATILSTRADDEATTWLAANTPADARVLVNSFLWYGASYIPADGGSWLPYTANRTIEFLDATAAPAKENADALAQWIDARHITYVYLGRRAGILRASDFTRDPQRYTQIYQQDGITVFRVVRK